MVNILADFVVKFNASARKNVEFFYLPYSSVTYRITYLLLKRRCISNFTIETHPVNRSLRLKVHPFFVFNQPLIKKLKLISKPGLRIYWTSRELAYRFARNNFSGFYILSTSRGVCSGSELLLTNTLADNFGGEVLVEVHF